MVAMVVHKEVIVTATSPDSWEDAALNAVERTHGTVENLQWAVVQDQSIEVQSKDDPQFKTKVKIGFEVNE
jgi:flavin-binding protein dodecin